MSRTNLRLGIVGHLRWVIFLMIIGGLVNSLWRGSPGRLSGGGIAYAADANRELEAEDDLTVSGQEGTKNDADLDVKGVSSFAKDIFIEAGILAGPYGGMGRYQNMLTYSEQFNNAIWAISGTAVKTVDAMAAPDGTTSADKLDTTSGTNTSSINQSYSGIAVTNKTFTFSVWLKADRAHTVTITLRDTNNAGYIATNCAVTTSWQRFSVTKAFTSETGNPQAHIYGGQDGSTTGIVYCWGAQLEEASAPGVYTKTTSSIIAASRGMVSGGDILMPSLKLSGGQITDTSGTVTVGSNLASTGNLQVTGAGPHYIQNGNVGIGITSPTADLQIGSTSASAITASDSIDDLSVQQNFSSSTASITVGGNLIFAKDTTTITGAGSTFNPTGVLMQLQPGTGGTAYTGKLIDLQVASPGGSLDSKFNVDSSGNVFIKGNLTTQGTQIITNTVTLDIANNKLVLNTNQTGAPTQDATIEVERGTLVNSYIKWNETTDKWEFYDGTTTANIGNMSSFTLAGTSGSSQTISQGDTLTIEAGTNISTTGAATDKVTVATLNNPAFSTSVTTPLVQNSSANLTLQTNTSGHIVLSPAGNVGIGTVSPSQKLHVEGQCVTGDTILSIFDAGRSLSAATPYVYGVARESVRKVQNVYGVARESVRKVQIKDVQPGMMVYSFNEELGIVEPHRITALLDMGVKPVFKLTTKDGKAIKTTGNHPYLVRGEVSEIKRQTVASFRLQEMANTQNLAKEEFSEEREFAQIKAIWRREGRLSLKEGKENSNLPGPEDKHPADNPCFGLSNFSFQLGNPLFKTFLGNFQYSFLSSVFYFIEDCNKGVSAFVSKPILQNFRYGNYSHDFLLCHLKDTICRLFCQAQNSSIAFASTSMPNTWLKVLYLKVGDLIAVSSLEPSTLNLERYVLWVQDSSFSVIARSPDIFVGMMKQSKIQWVEIQSIEYVGYEQVYDIEVEGTHNFIANGIIAHNTYLNGNVGIGTTSPTAKLHVVGSITATGSIGGVTPQLIKTIDLSPEFPTAVLNGSGTGIMTASFDAANFHNYYNWLGSGSNQAYDIYVRVLIPEDFGSWDGTAAVTYYTNIDATPVNSGVTLTVYDTPNTQQYLGSKVQTAGWAATTVAGAGLTGTYADGNYITLKFTMTADSGKNVKLGEVKLKYNVE